MKIKYLLLTILVFFLLILSISLYSCTGLEEYLNPVKEIEVGLDVYKDGWADLNIKILFDKDLYDYEYIVEGTKEAAESQGFRITQYSDGLSDGFIASTPIYLLALKEDSYSFEDTFSDYMQWDISEAPLKIEKGFLTTHYKFSSYMGSPIYTNQRFVLSLPGKYLENNADAVDDNKLIWDISGNRTIEAESQVVNIGPLILIIFISIVILAVVILVIYRAGKTTHEAFVYRQMNYCPKCGAKVTPGSNFCNKCGSKL